MIDVEEARQLAGIPHWETLIRNAALDKQYEVMLNFTTKEEAQQVKNLLCSGEYRFTCGRIRVIEGYRDPNTYAFICMWHPDMSRDFLARET